MKILLLGSGGREHALAWKIAQSKQVEKLYIAPGNAGTGNCGENVNIGVNDFEELKKFVYTNHIDMVVVGPEDPLVKGIYDNFANDPLTCNIPVIGPSKAGAVLEGSKDFAKAFMQRHNIPTARYQTFDGTTVEEGLKFLETLSAPYVLTADGLCAGSRGGPCAGASNGLCAGGCRRRGGRRGGFRLRRGGHRGRGRLPGSGVRKGGHRRLLGQRHGNPSGGGFQSALHAVADAVKQIPFVDEFDLGFGRVDVDVHQMLRQMQMEHAGGITPRHELIAISLLQSGGHGF